ncbi:hypothetical protein RB653_006442 [Dictyostelium firmibasis]|uniref:Right handed beta helix domain-containing protein n=1 Tax=Dictyostelium firmibasis TaxID=79012 RepID=A0AAN7Z593_9MYCE
MIKKLLFFILFIIYFTSSTKLIVYCNDISGRNDNNNNNNNTDNNNKIIKCNTYVDSSSNSTFGCGTLNFPCSTIYSAIQSCDTSYQEITITIVPGTYYINTTTFGIITNKTINIINNDTTTTTPPPSSSSSSSKNLKQIETDLASSDSTSSTQPFVLSNKVIIDLTDAIDSFINIKPSKASDLTTIYILGITFKNGNQSSGSVILNQGSWVDITIDQSSFINNVANQVGGSFAMISGIGNSGGGSGAINSTLTLINSSFINTTTTLNRISKLAPSSSSGGIIYSNSTTSITINECRFFNNSGGNGGIGYIWSGYLLMNNSSIDGSDCTPAFFFNSISGMGTGSPLFLVSNTTFSNATGGVGFVVFGDYSTTTFRQCTFSDNVNTTPLLLSNSFSNVLVDQCLFLNNNNSKSTLPNSAGAIHIIDSSLTIESSVFINNRAAIGGAIQINGSLPDQYVKIYNSIFDANNATEIGGSIYSQEGQLYLYSCQFLNNEAVAGSSVYCLNSNINFSNMTFSNNTDSSIPTPNGIGCGSGKVCSIQGDQQFQNSCSYDYQPGKPSLLTPGEVAAIVICVIIGAAIIATILILIVRKISRKRNGYSKIVNG